MWIKDKLSDLMSFTLQCYNKGLVLQKTLNFVSRGTLHMKQTEKKGSRNQTGALGEKIAADYLKKQGFSILDTNYLKKWGEIDIVARGTGVNDQIVRFVEVKAVSYETKADLETAT